MRRRSLSAFFMYNLAHCVKRISRIYHKRPLSIAVFSRNTFGKLQLPYYRGSRKMPPPFGVERNNCARPAIVAKSMSHVAQGGRFRNPIIRKRGTRRPSAMKIQKSGEKPQANAAARIIFPPVPHMGGIAMKTAEVRISIPVKMRCSCFWPFRAGKDRPKAAPKVVVVSMKKSKGRMLQIKGRAEIA